MKEDVLPEGWENRKLLDLCDIKTGKVDANHHSNDGIYPFFTCALEPLKSKTYSFDDELIILPGNGANVGTVFYYNGKIEAYQRTYVLHKIQAHPKFIYFHLLYSWKERTAKKQFGSATNYIRMSNFEEYSLPLPPISEQQYLSQKLTALLYEVAQTKQRLEAIPAILKQFRQSVLADAVSGRLTEEWRENNELSLSDWIQSNVGNIAKVETGKTPSRKNPEYWENGYIPWLTSSCTGLPYVNFADEFVTDLAVKECGLKIFNKNTLLLAMYGEGKTRGQVTELKLSATCNQACAAITANNNLINNQYLKLSLLKNYDEIRKSASGGNQPNLNLTKVREIKIQLPSLKEQTQIVQKVETYFALADEIETQVNAALENVNLLTQSILAKAFSGELSSTWRKENSQLI